jgi:hypothetical protein
MQNFICDAFGIANLLFIGEMDKQLLLWGLILYENNCKHVMKILHKNQIQLSLSSI